MNGISLLLLLATTAQVEPGTERDYGWQINNGVLEYIVQINSEKQRAMQQKSVAFPSGQENVSNMPSELVGRATRFVVRFGDEVLPRTPSLIEIDRMPRLFTDPLSHGATAQLGPGRMQDVESNVYNIQRESAQNIPPNLPLSLPAPPSNFGSNAVGENLIDQVGKAAGTYGDKTQDSLANALPLPGSNSFAQNTNTPQSFNTPQSGADFLNGARGGTGLGNRNNSIPGPVSTATNVPQSNNSGMGTSGMGATSSRLGSGSSTSPALGANGLSYPSLGQQTPPPRNQLDRNPSYTGLPTNGWNNSTAPATPNYQTPGNSFPPSYSTGSTYTNTPNSASNFPPYSNPPTASPQDPTYRVAANANPVPRTQPPQYESQPNQQPPIYNPAAYSLTNAKENLTPMDGALPVMFLLSLVVNFYLGILIRKLLMRYRSLLTNVRSQAA